MNVNEQEKLPYFIGKRICLDDYYGTVRYVGQLQAEQEKGKDSSKQNLESAFEAEESKDFQTSCNNPSCFDGGLWIGVEWDSNSRGKHNGIVNGEFAV